jgi:hypothetical protein
VTREEMIDIAAGALTAWWFPDRVVSGYSPMAVADATVVVDALIDVAATRPEPDYSLIAEGYHDADADAT